MATTVPEYFVAAEEAAEFATYNPPREGTGSCRHHPGPPNQRGSTQGLAFPIERVVPVHGQ